MLLLLVLLVVLMLVLVLVWLFERSEKCYVRECLLMGKSLYLTEREGVGVGIFGWVLTYFFFSFFPSFSFSNSLFGALCVTNFVLKMVNLKACNAKIVPCTHIRFVNYFKYYSFPKKKNIPLTFPFFPPLLLSPLLPPPVLLRPCPQNLWDGGRRITVKTRQIHYS